MTDKSRKALEREPTDEMARRGGSLIAALHGKHVGPHQRALEIWRAMFDAAPVLATAPAEPPLIVPCPACNGMVRVADGRLDLHGYMTGPEDAPFVQCSGSGFPLAATPSAPAMDAGDLNGPSQEGADGTAATSPVAALIREFRWFVTAMETVCTAPSEVSDAGAIFRDGAFRRARDAIERAEPPNDSNDTGNSYTDANRTAPPSGEVAALIERLRDAIAHYDYDGTVEPVLARLSAPVPQDVVRVATMLRQWSDDDCGKQRAETGRAPNKEATLGYIAARMLESAAAPVPDAGVMQNDLREILRAVGLSDCARPYSPHEVVRRELLPHLRALRTVIEKYDGNSNNPYWAEEFNQVMRIARARCCYTRREAVTDDAHVDESLASVKNLCEFAYEHGYHEHGYDPYKVVAEAIVALRARAETAERTVDRLALSLQADTETMLRANDCITKLEAEVVALREDAERYRWLMDVWDEACPFANGLPLWDYDSSMVDAAIDHERLAEKDKGG